MGDGPADDRRASCPSALESRVASPPRPPSARQQAPRHARGLRARGPPDRRRASRSCTTASGGSPSCSTSAAATRTSGTPRAALRPAATPSARPRSTPKRSPRRCARRWRSARSTSPTSCSSPAGASSATRRSCSPASASSSACRRGSTTWVNVDASTNHCPRVAAPGLLLRDRPRDEGARGRRHGGERRRPDVRARPPRRAAVCPRSARATCSRCWTSAATRRCSRTSSTCCRARPPCSSTATAAR